MKVDNRRLTKCVEEAESSGALPSLGELYAKVSELYNANVPNGMKPIAASMVRTKVTELGLKVKTISNKAKSSSVNVKLLQSCIAEAEKDGVARNWTELFAKVAIIYNQRASQAMSGAVLQSVAAKNSLKFKTPKGKKGMTPFADRKGGTRTKKADKFAKSQAVQEALEGMRNAVPPQYRERFLPVVEAVAKGSRSAAVKLKCLDCSGYSTAEIRQCPCNGCPLWPFRPYQGNVTAEDIVEETVVEA